MDQVAVRPTDLAAKLKCSVAYASQLLSGERGTTPRTALRVLDDTGVKIGPLRNATDEEIAALRKFSEAA